MSGTTGTAGNDNLNGGSGNDYIDGGAGNDIISGGSGNDTLLGGSGNDRLSGGAGSDTLDGGSGNDNVDGGSGNDVLIYRLTENAGSRDVYTGGSGVDTLQLMFTSAQWLDPSVQTQLAQYLQQLATYTNAKTGEMSNSCASDFTFNFTTVSGQTTTLTVQMTEKLDVWVDNARVDFHKPGVLVVDLLGAVKEDTAVVASNLTDSGVINFFDLDLGQTHSVSAAPVGANPLGGTLSALVTNTATADGVGAVTWTYTLNNNNPLVQALAVGETRTENFTVTITDNTGKAVSQVVAVTVTGTNDVVTITGATATGAVVEDGTPSATGTISFTDVDLIDSHSVSFAAAPGNTTTLGTFGLGSVSELANAASGSVGWTYNINNAAAQSLAAGQSVQETYVVTVNDGHGSTTTQNVVITIQGTNDAPVISVQDLVGAVTEQITPVGNLADSGVITFTDVDLSDVHLVSAVGTPVGSVLGSLTAVKNNDTTGTGAGGQLTWTYTVPDSAVEYLAAGQTKVESFTITLNDQHGGLITKQIDVTIHGTNDVAVIGGVSTAAVTEDASTPNLSTSGALTVADVDQGQSNFTAQPGTAGSNGHGSFTLAADGSWSYTASNSQSAIQQLGAGQSITDSFTAVSSDGSASQVVTVTIHGTNDVAVVAAVDVTGVVLEAATPVGNLTDTGTIAFTDVDVNDIHSLSVVTPSGGALGSLTASVSTDTTGSGLGGVVTWNYSVAASAVEYLAAGQTKVETFSFNVLDGQGGSVARTVSVTVTGTNDAPILAAITSPSAVLEAVNASAQDIAPIIGALSVADADVGNTLTASIAGTPTLVWSGGALTAEQTASLTAALVTGKLSFGGTATSNGASQAISTTWDPAAANLDFLAAGQTLTVTYGVRVNDGSTNSNTQNLSFTINGSNDAASDLIFTFTASPGNGLPNGDFGQMSLVDPDGGAGGYSFSLAGLTATTLAGGVAANFAGDLAVSSAGVISASNLDEDRVYEATIQVTQGAATFTETFSVITGTNSGPGTDTINGGYVTGDDVIFARGASDAIFAGSGNDTVFGQSGDDQIHGELGNDTLTGGAGNDIFYFDTALNAATNVDTITDFNANTGDRIHLDDDIFSAFLVGADTTLAAANFRASSGGNAADSNDFILYDTATGNLFYDADGSGAGAKVLFATLTLAGVSGTVDATDFTITP